MRAIRYILIGMWLLMGLSTCHHAALKQGMADLDRYYLPALYWASEGDEVALEGGLNRLMVAWEVFQQNHKNLATVDPYWIADVEQATLWLEASQVSLIYRNDIEEVYVQLDHFRYTLMDIRHRYGITYFLDEVHDFHQVLEQEHQIAEQVRLSKKDWTEIYHNLQDLKCFWSEIQGAKIDAKVFNLSAIDLSKLKAYQQQTTKVLRAFEEEVSKENHQGIHQRLHELKQSFMPIYTVFGAFHTQEIEVAVQ